MNFQDSNIAFNREGVHIVPDNNPVTAAAAGCKAFVGLKACGGDVVFKDFVAARRSGDTGPLKLSSGDFLPLFFTGVTVDTAASTGKGVLTKVGTV
jgi:hypothetical protein